MRNFIGFATDPGKKFFLTILVLAIISICFLGIFNRDPWLPDEPRVAAIALEMSHSGNIVVPMLSGEPFIEKPPLYFAMAAGLVHTLGPIVGNTGAIRFTSTLFALATLLVFFLLAQRLGGRAFAFPALMILGTMAGFVENFHWIRVDPALTFFITAAIWSFSETYLAKRPWFLIGAGFFSAGAFLAKGFIGPVLIFIPWVALFFLWLKETRKQTEKKNFYLFPHLSAFLVFAAIAGVWIAALKITGGEKLWHEWFWVNHVGRLTGTATVQGHIHPHKPLYYLSPAIKYTLPWTPLVLIWIVSIFRQLRQPKSISQENILLFVWGLGSIILLSITATKRSMYLYPILPVFALMGAMALQKGVKRWFDYYTNFWTIISIIGLGLLTISPLASLFLKSLLPAPALNVISTFGWQNIIAGICFIIAILIFRKRQNLNVVLQFTAIITMLYITILTGPVVAVDQLRSLRAETQKFVTHIDPQQRARVAGWNFHSIITANFYYYFNWKVPQIRNHQRLQAILEHKDPEFDSIILCNVKSLSDLIKVPYQILARGNPQHSHKKYKRVIWIKGLPEITNSSRRK